MLDEDMANERVSEFQDIPEYSAHELIGEKRYAYISLDGRIYKLQITKKNKLILTAADHPRE